MYALRNLFRSMQQMDMSGREIKSIIPDVVNDLNYTTGLMENLLHWVKGQMHSALVSSDELDLKQVTDEAMHVHQLQASTKKITVTCEVEGLTNVLADKEMINLVFRNLLSNAIKFTPENGFIIIRLKQESTFCRVCIIDNGIRMDHEVLTRSVKTHTTAPTVQTVKAARTGSDVAVIFFRKWGELLIKRTRQSSRLLCHLLMVDG
jgi:signal transduction histidine kinase